MKRSVVLIHGIDDTAHCLRFLSQFLRAQGFETYEFEYSPSNGSFPLEDLAEQLESYIQKKGLIRFDVVGFSMGGIIARYYIQKMEGYKYVQQLITLSSPHYGTWLAYLRRGIGVRQLRPKSSFLQKINDDLHHLHAIKFTSVYTPFDLAIVPSNSSRMALAHNISLPVLFHPWMLRDLKVLKIVAKILKSERK